MRVLKYIVLFSFFLTCDRENLSECFRNSGDIVHQEIDVELFDKILVNRGVELIVKEGLEQNVVVETGRNLLKNVEVFVSNAQLVLSDNNFCNYTRKYGLTKVYITSPNIREIRSSTQYDISSDGVLTYSDLTILSENFTLKETYAIGDFNLQIDNNTFRLVFNNLSNCFISGRTNSLNITFGSGTSRFEGAELKAQNVVLWNRSSNDMVVNPQQSITGTISGVGDVVALRKPVIVEVEEQYKGRLIFR